MGRRRSHEPKRHQLCVRLTDKQFELLHDYTSLKGLDSEVSAIRKMIDGLEDWLRRQRSSVRTPVDPPSAGRANSGPPPPRQPLAKQNDAPQDDVMDDITSVGDFAGRPVIGLPEPRFDED